LTAVNLDPLPKNKGWSWSGVLCQSQKLTAIVYENMYFICSFTHKDRSTGEKTQIASGCIVKTHSRHETGDELYTLKLCSPRGAKAASNARKDILYQDRSADCSFHLNYFSKRESKVEDKDKNYPEALC